MTHTTPHFTSGLHASRVSSDGGDAITHAGATFAHRFSLAGTRRPIVALALAALLGLTSLGCQAEADAAQAEEPSAAPAAQPALKGKRVEVAVVKPSTRGMSLRVPGEVEGIRDAELAAAMGGYIEQVAVEEGEHVKKGAVLARVDSQTYSARLIRAQIEQKAAERELARVQSLGDTIATAEVDAAQDRVDAAKATLAELQVAVSRTVINAPFAGVVVRVDAEVGEVAGPGAPLFRLVQLSPVRVSVALSDRDIALARVGMPAAVEVGASPGMHQGKVVQLSQAANLKTRSFEALVELPNEKSELLPGMIAQVTLKSAENAADGAPKLLVSQDWLVTDPEGVGAFIAKDGKAVWRELELGPVVRRQVEVLSGIGPGDELIIVGHRTLQEGDEVLIHRKGVCCENGRAVFDK